ncbi:acyl-CoA thioesterase [Myxococcota bacterium]|nr:acyl-CoA thioesterase [Myxococcota bacterium]MBU1380725.1 acyl-CoA thioesterase [Myxococcota bacterium]MBU1498047.1 acyl-CoA thioesterase [Myxococcota bacterium]
MSSDFTSFETIVQSTHLDSFGHVNNAKFLEYFEWARWDWARKKVDGFEKFLEEGYAPALVKIEITFLKELHHYEKIKIETTTGERGNRSFSFIQKLYNSNGELCSEAISRIVFIDLNTRKSVDIPAHFSAGLGSRIVEP